jgi:hypothetical protein
MEEPNLIEQIGYCCKLFMRIVIFALFGVIFSYALNVDPITGYKIIIAISLIGAIISVGEVINRIFNE